MTNKEIFRQEYDDSVENTLYCPVICSSVKVTLKMWNLKEEFAYYSNSRYGVSRFLIQNLKQLLIFYQIKVVFLKI